MNAKPPSNSAEWEHCIFAGTAPPNPATKFAAGVALLAWAVLSVLALRGLSVAPASCVHVDVHNAAPPVPEINLPKPEPTSYTPYYSTRQQPPSLNTPVVVSACIRADRAENDPGEP
jgi:hypothetical protein